MAWTGAFLVYLCHVAAAFTFYHHWSHQAAYEETAQRTAELFGVRSGSGLYWNYAFTAVWAFDIIWIWRSAPSCRSRPRAISVAIHSFMAFMFFNAIVVFASGWIRWLGVAMFAALAVLKISTAATPATAGSASPKPACRKTES